MDVNKRRQNNTQKSIHGDVSDLPLFSVIILTYLQNHLLKDCIDSILMQTYPNIELIICDDCSADFNEKEVLQYITENKMENVKNVIVYKQPQNVGTTANAQKGVELSTGVYFKLHAGDDMLFDENVLTEIEQLLCKADVHLIAARSVACYHDGTMTEHYYPSAQAVAAMKNGNAQRQFELIGTQAWGEYVNAPAVFWKRAFFDEVGGFDLSYKYTEDWPMWLKITGQGYRITTIEKVTTIYRYGGISNDSSSMNATLGKAHYIESVRLLKEYALSKFEEEGNKKKIMRCRQCIRCLNVRMEVEGNWDTWTCIEKLVWRCKNIKFLLISWIYRKRMYGMNLPCRGLYIFLAACLAMFVVHASVWPGVSLDIFWAWAAIVAIICIIARKGVSKAINLLVAILNRRNHG